MEIAYLIPAHAIFTKPRLHFLYENFQEYKFHSFVFETAQATLKLEENENTTICHRCSPIRRAKQIHNIIKKYDKVIFDSSFLPPFEKLLLIILLMGNYSKLVWIEWGHDLFLAEPLNFLDSLKIKVKHILQSLFEKKIPEFIAIYPPDVLYYKLKKGRGNVHYAPYRSTKRDWQIGKICSMSEKSKQKKNITIQIGQRAEPFLQHKKILDLLYPYAGENIRILLPLSYGIKKYADEVSSYAKSLFDEKVICLTEVLPFSEYEKILNDVDIFILNSKRQIALGNVHQFLQKGKKNYLPKESILSQYYREQGIEIADIESLANGNYSELISDLDYSIGQKWMWQYDQQNPVDLWRKVFNEVLKNE